MKYSTGIQDFGKLREMGYTYVDKTQYVRKLVETPGYYFLSRPRRFGKSLFLSTLEKYFLGRRDLFGGLDIDTDDIDWTPRPVFKFSLNTIDPKTEDSLINSLSSVIRDYEAKYQIPGRDNDIPSRFSVLIRTAFESTGRKVAVLVDEYDSPLLNTLENEHINSSYRDTMRAFFSVLKSADEYIYLAFITGVTRFSHTSLFSGANNLRDISLQPEYSAICGITEDELKDVFMPGVHDFAQSSGISDQEMLSLLKENYDGYHFSEKSPDIYNPFSLLNALQSQRIDNYWFQSGTPASFLKALRRHDFYLPDLDCIETTSSGLSISESFMRNPIGLLYEAGYLTIKDYDYELKEYTLSLPNKEVAASFSEALMPYYSEQSLMECQSCFIKMRRAVIKGEPELFMKLLQTFLAGNPYGLTELAKREKYFENNIFLIFKALGFMPRAEVQTCNACMDLILQTRRYTYIFELKTDGSAKEAMQQIEDRGYALPYAHDGKQIIKIAANYSSATNNIDSWLIV